MLNTPTAKPEQLAAGIAHEHTGGIGIEAQEAEHRAGECQAPRPRPANCPPLCASIASGAQAKKRRAARQAVEAVGKIDRIGDAHQEKPRVSGTDTHAGNITAVIQRDRVNLDVPADDDDQDRKQLADELDAVVKIEAIVQYAEHGQHHRGEQEIAIASSPAVSR